MRRREFFGLVGGATAAFVPAVAWSQAAAAQAQADAAAAYGKAVGDFSRS